MTIAIWVERGLAALAALPLVAGCAVSTDEVTSRASSSIVGGTTTPAPGYPGVGALVSVQGGAPSSPICTTVLIDPTHALTAAHCVALNPGLDFAVLQGANPRDASAAQVVPVEAAIVSPDFVRDPSSPSEALHDIAVVTLSRAVEDVTTFPRMGSPSVGEPLTLVGYGPSVAPPAVASGVQNQAETAVASVSALEFSVGPSPAPQPCFGDSGGPAFSAADTTILTGLVSRAAVDSDIRCSQGAIYTRVDTQARWIASVVAAPLAQSPPSGCAVGGGRGGAGSAIALTLLTLMIRRRRAFSHAVIERPAASSPGRSARPPVQGIETAPSRIEGARGRAGGSDR